MEKRIRKAIVFFLWLFVVVGCNPRREIALLPGKIYELEVSGKAGVQRVEVIRQDGRLCHVVLIGESRDPSAVKRQKADNALGLGAPVRSPDRKEAIINLDQVISIAPVAQ